MVVVGEENLYSLSNNFAFKKKQIYQQLIHKRSINSNEDSLQLI